MGNKKAAALVMEKVNPEYVDYSVVKINETNKYLKRLKHKEMLELAKALGFVCSFDPIFIDDNITIVKYVDKGEINGGAVEMIQRQFDKQNTNRVSNLVLCDYDIDYVVFGNLNRARSMQKVGQDLYEKYNDFMIERFGRRYLKSLFKHLVIKMKEYNEEYSNSAVKPKRMEIYRNLIVKYSKQYFNKKAKTKDHKEEGFLYS